MCVCVCVCVCMVSLGSMHVCDFNGRSIATACGLNRLHQKCTRSCMLTLIHQAHQDSHKTDNIALETGYHGIAALVVALYHVP